MFYILKFYKLTVHVCCVVWTYFFLHQLLLFVPLFYSRRGKWLENKSRRPEYTGDKKNSICSIFIKQSPFNMWPESITSMGTVPCIQDLTVITCPFHMNSQNPRKSKVSDFNMLIKNTVKKQNKGLNQKRKYLYHLLLQFKLH